MFAVEREFDIEATIIHGQGTVITLRPTHKWSGASAHWRQPDGEDLQVMVGLDPVISDRRPDHLAGPVRRSHRSRALRQCRRVPEAIAREKKV